MPRFSECWRCGKKDSSLMCVVCNVAKYCSRKCKKNDQARHKTDCGAAAVLKTCSACGETSSTLKSCSSCLRAFYCDSKCQKKDWPTHMTRCKEAEKKIKSIAQRIELFNLVVYSQVCIEQYYWGNSPAFDCLNLEENEGSQIRNMNILFLGVGDLRNVALSCASLPESHEIDIKVTLNDVDCSTLARLILLLYMLIKGESGIEKSIPEIWYSVLLSEQSYTTLCTYLRELADIPNSAVLKLNTNGLVSIDENHLKEMKFVWKTWLSLRVKKTTWMQEQRQKIVDSDPGSKFGKIGYYNSIPSEHVKSAKKWMNDGVFNSTRLPLVAENPTLTGPQPMSRAESDNPFSYCCPSDALPFSGWDYLQVKKFKHCDSIVTMYGAYIQDVLQRFKRRLATKHVTFQAILGNCVEIDRFLDPGVKFDRILTSNLIDYISIPRLLKLCSTMLNHGNPYATIVTETQNWVPTFCKDADGAFRFEIGLINAAMEDTHNVTLVSQGSGTSIREYHDNSAEFLDYLRASFHARFAKEEQSKETKRRKLPIAKELGNAFGLRLRDYARNENRLVFFKLAVNCRRVTMIAGVERTLEWVPM